MYDIWTTTTCPLWVDFVGDRVYYPKPMPFVSDCTIHTYAINNFRKQTCNGLQNDLANGDVKNLSPTSADLYLLVASQSAIKLSLNRYQYLFFIHALEHISTFAQVLDTDLKCFAKESFSRSVSVNVLAPLIELSLILPPNAPQSPYDEQSFGQNIVNQSTESLTNSSPGKCLLALLLSCCSHVFVSLL